MEEDCRYGLKTIKCSFRGCTNKNPKTPKKSPINKDNISFSTFPMSATRSEKWAKACQMVSLMNAGSCSNEVCHDHFEPQSFPQFGEGKGSKINWNAVPSLPAYKNSEDRFKEDSTVIYPMIKDWGPMLCRLCAKPVSLSSHDRQYPAGYHIFGCAAQSVQLLENINVCLRNPVTFEDDLPKFVCRACIIRLNDAVIIVKSFQSADQKLRDELKNSGNLKSLEGEGNHGIFNTRKCAHTCSICSKGFLKLNELLKHEIVHNLLPKTSTTIIKEPTKLPLQCDKCNSQFICKTALHLHTVQTHNGHNVGITNLKLSQNEQKYDYTFENPLDIIKHENALRLLDTETILDDLYECEKCSAKFETLQILTEHILNKKCKIFECDQCKIKFKTLAVLKRHINKHNEFVDKITCGHCNKKFTIRLYRKHKENLIICKHCNDFFDTKEYKKHILKLRHNNYTCDMCNKVFKTRNYLVMHIKNSHNPSEYKCSKCQRSFKTKDGLKGHLLKHEGKYEYLCDICGKNFLTQSALRTHRRTHTAQNFFECNICSKRIQEHNRYQDHLRKHNGETPFGCEICNRKFHSKKLLKQHMQIHSNIRPYKCLECNLSFKRIGNLKQHIQRHGNYRPTCSICKSSFDNIEERNEHRSRHTLEEREQAKLLRLNKKGLPRNRSQFLCKGCKTVFDSKQDKEKHLLDNPDHVKTIKCDTCDLTFRSYQSLYVHQRIHTGERPYSCTVCFKNFRTLGMCKQHILIHSNENKYQCNLCNRGFNRMYTLNIHKRSHSNERPFECSTCGRGFKQKGDMKKHMKVHADAKDQQERVDKWGLLINDEVLQPQNLCETITIPNCMEGIQYDKNNLLTANNIVITVPFVPTDPQTFFNM